MVCLFICFSVRAQTKAESRAGISIDMTSMILHRNVEIGFSHSFAEKWSAEGGMSIHIPDKETISEEKAEHEMMFGDWEKKSIGLDMAAEFRMGFRFWPKKFLEGGYIGLSCTYNMESGTDIGISAGYAIRIWKCLGLWAGYEIRLLEGIAQGRFGTEGINIGINLSF